MVLLCGVVMPLGESMPFRDTVCDPHFLQLRWRPFVFSVEDAVSKVGARHWAELPMLIPHLSGQGCWILFQLACRLRPCLRLRRTSTASSRSQCSAPDPHSSLWIKVSSAGPELQALDRRGRRTRTATSGSK